MKTNFAKQNYTTQENEHMRVWIIQTTTLDAIEFDWMDKNSTEGIVFQKE